MNSSHKKPVTHKNNRATLKCCFKLCASFHSHQSIQTGVTVRKRQIWVEISDIFVPCDLEFWRMTLKKIGHLSYAASSFVHHFIAIGEFKLELQSGNAQFGSNSTILLARNFKIWQMTLKNNRAHLLSSIKLCASFHRHMWIQAGVTVLKRLNGFMTSVTLTFDLLPWPSAWTSRLSMIITPENFRMIRWQKHRGYITDVSKYHNAGV